MYLADLDIKIRKYKTRLEELGQYLSSGEDSDNEIAVQDCDLFHTDDGYHGNPEYPRLEGENVFPTLPPQTTQFTPYDHYSPSNQLT